MPTVTVVHDKLLPSAQAQARVLNMPSLPIASVPQPMPWNTPDDERRKGESIVEDLVRMLIQARAEAAKG